MTSWNREELVLEAKKFHFSVFKREASDEVIKSYIEGHHHLLKVDMVKERDVHRVRIMIEKDLDMEACEFALRSPQSLLTKKFWLLTYICETQSGYYNDFHATESISKVLFFLMMIKWSFVTVIKKIKGKWLVWRYNLA